MHDVVVIGSGPAGLAVLAEASRSGLRCGLVEKHCLAGNLCRYPHGLQFRSLSADFELEGMPLVTATAWPLRNEVIRYYQKAARRLENIQMYLRHRASEVIGSDNAFLVKCTNLQLGKEVQIRCRKVVIASGCYDQPRLLQIAGETLPHVSHYYSEPWACEGANVVIVGGGDSAAEAALETATVARSLVLVYRGADLSRVRPWVRGSLERLIAAGKLVVHTEARLNEIREDRVIVQLKTRGEQSLPADAVFLLTGYRPDDVLLQKSGITIDLDGMVPVYFEETCETNIAGMYVAGAILGGTLADSMGIEKFRSHAQVIVRDIQSKI